MMRRSVRRLTAPAAVALAAACLVVPAAGARAESKAQVPDTAIQPQQDIPDQKIDAAATAMQQVASMKESYLQKLDTAPASDKERIANEANAALTKAVTDQGLSVEEYSAILVMAQNDPVVRGKILERVRSPQK